MRKFFRVIWRINALVICLLGSVFLGLAVFGLVGSFLEPRHFGIATPASVKGTVEENKSSTDNIVVGKVEGLPGTTIVRAMLQISDESGGLSLKSSRGYSNTTCNYVFYDSATDRQTTLFPSNTIVIVDSDDYYFPAEPDETRVTKWTSFVIADKDTNHDGVISEDDAQSLAVARPDGQDYKVYLTGLDRVLYSELVGENDFYTYYNQGHKLFVARIDLAGKKIVSMKQLF